MARPWSDPHEPDALYIEYQFIFCDLNLQTLSNAINLGLEGPQDGDSVDFPGCVDYGLLCSVVYADLLTPGEIHAPRGRIERCEEQVVRVHLLGPAERVQQRGFACSPQPLRGHRSSCSMVAIGAVTLAARVHGLELHLQPNSLALCC